MSVDDALPEAGDGDPSRVAHFRILGRLGQGGMGVVYRAEDESLRRTVALKLLPDPTGSEERKQRFLREARSAAAITHPNVAVVHQVGEADGRVYIAMELIEGESLRARLERGRLDAAEARELGLQIARGLAAAHDKGIVHRDLKPENVMITLTGEVKLLDFGLAKPEPEKTSSSDDEAALAKTQTLVTSRDGAVLGTPEYMSPEQAMGAPLDVRSDVFSLGIVLYEMLSGTRPFTGGSSRELAVAIARDAAPPLRERAPEVDAATEAIVMRCLAKKADGRFATAGEVAAALSGPALATTTASMTALGPITDREPVRVRQRRGLATVVGLACVVLGFATWTVSRRSRPATSPAASASAPAASAPHKGVAITDHPAPKTASPEAAAAYSSGLQRLRDAEGAYAGDDFTRAARLDPAMAAADLRAVVYPGYAEWHRLRELYAAALAHRAALDERDLLILKVAESNVSDPPMPDDEVVKRARAVVERFPDDAEGALLLGGALLETDVAAGRAELGRALELDPQFAGAVSALASTYETDDAARAIELYGRCLEITPSAGTCLRARAKLSIDFGRCEEAEADARRLAVVEPDGHRTYELLAVTLAARRAPVETIRDVLARRIPLEPDERSRHRAEIERTLWTATLEGDLESAAKAARAWDALYSESVVARDHSPATNYLLDLLDETGETARALDAADAYERHATTGSDPWTSARIAFLRHRARRIDEATFRRALDGTTREALASGSRLTAWELAFLANATTAAEATEALSTMPDAGALGVGTLFEGAWLGRAYLLAGRPDAALPHLRRGAATCAILPNAMTSRAYPIWWMRVHVLLGEALEQTGDRAGACAAYAVVLDRWRGAKPRSVTLDEARARSKALACAP